MSFVYQFLTIFTSPSKTTGEPAGIQVLMGLIALGIFVWGARGLMQWKSVDGSRRARYIFLVVLSSVIFFVSLARVFHDVGRKIVLHQQKRQLAGSSFGYTVEHGTCAAYDHPVSECSTYAK